MHIGKIAPHLIIIGLFLNCTALFMTVPVLTLYLSEFNLKPTQIGFIDGAIALIGATFSFSITKKASQHLSPLWALVLGDFLIGCSYLAFTLSSAFWSFFSFACLMGLSRALSEPASKTLLGLYPINGKPELMFRARYICLCLGSLVGPAVGMLIPSKSKIILCTGLIMCTYSLLLISFHLLNKNIFGPQKTQNNVINQKIALKDRTLRILILAGCLIYLIFSQYESMVPLAMVGFIEDPKSAFSLLMIVNAVLGILFQIPYSTLSKQFSPKTLGIVGSLLFSLSFLVFSRAHGDMVLWVVGACLFTLGESLCLPLGDMLIDRLAPVALKPSYFSLGELRTLGFFFGPALGGILLQNYGSGVMFTTGALLALGAGLFYNLLKLTGPEDAGTSPGGHEPVPKEGHRVGMS